MTSRWHMSAWELRREVRRNRSSISSNRILMRELQATADRRLELLREWNTRRINEQEPCMFCGEWPIADGTNEQWVYSDNHADDCELAEELDDG